MPQFRRFLPFTAIFTLLAHAYAAEKPPTGFFPLINGKDFTGWRGGDTFDHRKLMEMPEEKRAELLKKWTDDMLQHWKVENDELVNDGHGKYCTTEKEYGDFELLVEYNMAPKGDSGIYLRNVPQVQIWDATDPDGGKLGRSKGSGGLWNNAAGSPGKDPLVLADRPAGEWNKFRILVVGSRVSVWLNEKLVVDHAILENYYDNGDKNLAPEARRPIPARAPICLQTHGAPIRWRNIFIREIGAEEARKILSLRSADKGFKGAFDGKTLDGWAGPVENYEIEDGAIRCKAGKGGTIYWKEELTDFVARLEFKVPPGGNNGLAVRYPGEGDTAYVGFCELQVLDDNYEKVRGKIDPRQAHGSAYGMVAAARGYQYPVGEWNLQEVTVKGSTIRVELNGTVILNADLSKIDPASIMGGKPHPGVTRTSGFFGFAGHSDPVAFRNIEIRKL